jgi:hypothetical protein
MKNQDVDRFRDKLIEAAVDRACKMMGLDFEETFIRPAEAQQTVPYLEYQWVVAPHSLVKQGQVIHAMPPARERAEYPWEEWFLLDGTLHHNVLYTKKGPETTGVFEGALDDRDHPLMALGRTWHYFTAPSLIPVRFQDHNNRETV